MWDILSALIPPAVVATVFCTFIYKLLRREMAPRTSDGRLVSEAEAASGANSTSVETGGTGHEGTDTDGASKPSMPAAGEVPEDETGTERP
ncbi:hypothetical protein RIF23_16685 [Lipingzhangella sp. LS1_29]|uniref:Uncharacterized protein n=1 Tax=Lipingzhangella rawalii TaxID=2055835 RepID=A0ABU2H9D9_9ACTN|nr:hypothetical protein [Lipingzhangella rawalii]MDS1271931.1 hypothetical protein [Lipingzhangella rawalii]